MITYGGNAELSFGAFVLVTGFLLLVLIGFIVFALKGRSRG